MDNNVGLIELEIVGENVGLIELEIVGDNVSKNVGFCVFDLVGFKEFINVGKTVFSWQIYFDNKKTWIQEINIGTKKKNFFEKAFENKI